MITTLRIKKEYKTNIDVAIRWYSIISILNNFNWRPLDIKILAFLAVEGTLSSGGRKEKFKEVLGSTKNTIYNYTSDLHKAGYIIYREGKLELHPQLKVDFSSPLFLELLLTYERS